MTDDRSLTVITHKKIHLYVDKANSQWIALDGDGNFWVLPMNDNPWERRQKIQISDELKLEPVPGHYKHMLGIPG
jgi:hypothetical protein